MAAVSQKEKTRPGTTQEQIWMKARALKVIRDRRLYKVAFEKIDIDALNPFDSEGFLVALCEELESDQTLPVSFEESSNMQRVARWFLLQAYKHLCGLPATVPEPLLRLGLFRHVCDLVFAYHNQNARVKSSPCESKRSKTIYGSVVYFLQAEGIPFVKIGHSTISATRRMANLQTGCPMPLKVLADCPGDIETEQRIHHRFSHLRERGEWFRLEPELQDFIDRLKADAQ